MPHSHPEDRSALHLDMLAERLAESADGDARDHANVVGLAIHPVDARDVRGMTDADREVVSLLEHIIVHKFAGLALHETVRAAVHSDAIGDVVQRLVRSAIAFRLAGNEHPALEQWSLAGALLFGKRCASVIDPAAEPTTNETPRTGGGFADVFRDAGFTSNEVAVFIESTRPRVIRVTLTREPTLDELIAIVNNAHQYLNTSDIECTRGTRTVHVPADYPELSDLPLQYSVDGDEEDGGSACNS